MRVGSVVILNSGGPKMTITGFAFGKVCCQWFCDNVLKAGTFEKECLQLVSILEYGGIK